MTYTLEISNPAKKDFRNIPETFQEKIRSAIRLLSDDPRPDGVVKLKGFKDLYRIRVGDYRIIYSVDDAKKLIIILKVSQRGGAYKP